MTKEGMNIIDQLVDKFSLKEQAVKDWPKEFLSPNQDLSVEPKTTEWDGFISQEVKAAADKLGVEYSGWTADHRNTREELDYARFVVPLVKAVQELSQQVEDLKAKIN